MKVKSKLAIATGVGFLALLIVFYVSARAVISSSLNSAEVRVYDALPGITSIFNSELDDLGYITAVAAKNPESVQALLNPPPEGNVEPTARDGIVIADTGVNLFSIIDMEGKVRAGILRSPFTDKPDPIPQSFLRYFSPDGALLSSFKTNSVSPRTGVFLVGTGDTNIAYLVGVAPVVDPAATSPDAPPLGVLLFGRDIQSPHFTCNLPNGVVVKPQTLLSTGKKDNSQRRPGIYGPLDELTSDKIQIEAKNTNGKKFGFSMPVQDIYGDDGLKLNVSLDSSLHGVADETKLRLLFVVAAIGIVFFIPVFIMQFRVVNGRISKLVKMVDGVAPFLNDQHIDWTKNDELSPVADKINVLLKSFDDEHAKARASEQFANAFIAASPNTIVTVDNNGKIIESVLRLGGTVHSPFADKFAVGKSIFDLHGGRADNFHQAFANIAQPGSCHISEFSMTDEEGGVAWVEAHVVRIDEERILVLCRDITIRRTSGLERAKLEDKINQIQKTESFGLLAGGLAHDYNNMLTAMLGNVDLILCDKSIEPNIRETVGDVRAAMLRASSLVRRMLAYACKSAPVIEPTDINTMVKDLVRLMRRSIPDNAKLLIVPGERIPIINVDSTQLWQVVMNLIINACDALNGRQGTVRVTTLGLEMTEAELASLHSASPLKDGWYSVIEVEDTGSGMDERTQKRIFDPFFTTKTNGKGLGLSSVISIIKSYGGGIGVRSQLGQGTTFKIVLPSGVNESGDPIYSEDLAKKNTASIAASIASVKVTTDKLEPPVTAATPAAESISAQPVKQEAPVVAAAPASPKTGTKTLLVVDDDISILKLLKIILKSGGYNIVTAMNGKDGLKTYEKSDVPICLALVDASMGAGMNGMELCAEIRKLNSSIPLILMSAYKAKEMSAKMASSGINAFLSKPFRGNDVVDLVTKYLKLAEEGAINKGDSVGAVV